MNTAHSRFFFSFLRFACLLLKVLCKIMVKYIVSSIQESLLLNHCQFNRVLVISKRKIFKMISPGKFMLFHHICSPTDANYLASWRDLKRIRQPHLYNVMHGIESPILMILSNIQVIEYLLLFSILPTEGHSRHPDVNPMWSSGWSNSVSASYLP